MPVILLSNVWDPNRGPGGFHTKWIAPKETKWTESTNQSDIWIQVPGIDLKLDPQTKVLS